MLQFWRNHKFREVEINPEHHAFAQARWDAWIHSSEYEKIFRQYFREYDGQQLAGDHDFDDWNYRKFMHSAAYNQALAGWVWCRKYDEEKERQKEHEAYIEAALKNEYMIWLNSVLLKTSLVNYWLLEVDTKWWGNEKNSIIYNVLLHRHDLTPYVSDERFLNPFIKELSDLTGWAWEKKEAVDALYQWYDWAWIWYQHKYDITLTPIEHD